jgi:hypothetical protein
MGEVSHSGRNARGGSGLAAYVAVLIGGVAFAAGSMGTADAGGTKPVTAAQAKKIASKAATKAAAKAIQQAAPTLHVGSADTATSAQSAVNAANAANAAKVGGVSAVSFGVGVPDNGPAVVLGELANLRLTATCPAGIPTIRATALPVGTVGGGYRFSVFNGDTGTADGSGNNVLPAGGTGNLTLGATLGDGTFDYHVPGGTGLNAWYGVRHENASCSFFGTMLGK